MVSSTSNREQSGCLGCIGLLVLPALAFGGLKLGYRACILLAAVVWPAIKGVDQAAAIFPGAGSLEQTSFGVVGWAALAGFCAFLVVAARSLWQERLRVESMVIALAGAGFILGWLR